MKKHSTARRVLALGLNLTLAGVPALLWADEEPTELPALTVSAGAGGETPPALDLDDSAGGGSRLGLSLRETPGSVSVANRASFERRGLRSTQDIANSLPGVNASAPPGFGGFVTYRGFSSNQVNQLFNGIPVQYSSAMRPLDDWIVDRVELVGGPSSFLNGAGAVGGSLDYISKLADRYGDFMEGRVRYGSYDDSEVAFGFNQALGIGPEPKHFVRLDVSRSGGNGYVDRNSRESWNVAFSLLSDLTPDLSHTLALEYQDEQEDSPYWGTPVLNPYAGEPEDRQEPSPRELQCRRWPLRTARALAALDPRIPGQRQHALAQHLLPLRRRARLPQPRDLPLQRRQQRGGALQRIPPAPRPAGSTATASSYSTASRCSDWPATGRWASTTASTSRRASRVPPPGRSVRSIRPVSSRATSTTCRACVPATGRTAATRCAPARCSPRTAWA